MFCGGMVGRLGSISTTVGGLLAIIDAGWGLDDKE
jgi:hypothetical protein